jgi:caffeoyl-CoA O-methyltransferase
MNLLEYALAHSTPDSPEAGFIIPSTQAQHEMPGMICGATEARLLQLLLLSLQARRVLELGCFTGYSALSMAEALPEGGEVISLEIDPRIAAMAAKHLEKSPHGPKVKLILGPALSTLPTLSPGFDLAFIDADKTRYPLYLEAVTPLVRQGGLIALDNTWLEGSVLAPKGPAQEAMAGLNKALSEDKRFRCLFLPIRDGLTLLYKY